MYDLTDRQREVLQFVEECCTMQRDPPTVREVAVRFGITLNAAYDHLKAIDAKGALARIPGMAKGLVAMGAMTAEEMEHLARCERTIEEGKRTFIEVGTSLATIREGRLYRDRYNTFEVYCRDRWGFARTYAHYMIEAAKVAENVHNCEREPPKTEAVARVLGRVPPERQAAVLDEAREAVGREPTAAEVRQVIEERQSRTVEPREEPGRRPAPSPDEDDSPSLAEALEKFVRQWMRRWETPLCIVASVLENLTERVKDWPQE